MQKVDSKTSIKIAILYEVKDIENYEDDEPSKKILYTLKNSTLLDI